MLKMRLTFVDNEEGNNELEKAMEELSKTFDILNKSKVYKGRGSSQYSNIYLDVEAK